jgi:hypothetical protein
MYLYSRVVFFSYLLKNISFLLFLYRFLFSFKQLATAFAICLSFSRIGSALNFAVEKPVANSLGFSYALWASAVFCVVSTLAGMWLSRIDKMGEDAGIVGKNKNKTLELDENGVPLLDQEDAAEDVVDEEDANWRDVGKVMRCREILMYGSKYNLHFSHSLPTFQS